MNERLPLDKFIERMNFLADNHEHYAWARVMKEAAERLQEFKDEADLKDMME